MERMIGDLLDLTQARLAGAIPITRGQTDLKRVCEEVMLEVRTAHGDVVLRWETRGNLVGAWDADRLAQVVSNLLGNAIQHGGGTPVTLAAREDRARWSRSPSITAARRSPPKPCHSSSSRSPGVRPRHATHSLGLGLFIARAIVSAHGGDIEVSSSSDDGTTFTVRLPKCAALLAVLTGGRIDVQMRIVRESSRHIHSARVRNRDVDKNLWIASLLVPSD